MKNLGIFLTGAITGALAGIIFAPNTGSKTRKLIAKEMDHTIKDWEKTLAKTTKDIRTEYNRKLDDFSKQGKEWMTEAKEAIRLN